LQVVRNDRFFDSSILDRSAGNPVPLPGGSSPIKHVIYVVKENWTYDQVLGDEPAGNGDQSLTLFGKSVTPNLHALAERFGVLDNFYADAQVSADGHNWALSANANDYDEKLWPQDYSATPGRNFGYPFEGGTALPQSPGGCGRGESDVSRLRPVQ
jgi:phospholipase C